ncbi:MAG: hypothetical protein IPM56_16140 [Ignavibacteriales bacterium]|nr:MAG: hypothetical protein IPM56_16140 [Ignavibacteriales bacterium]
MQCPDCLYEYKDPNEEQKGLVTQQNDHFFRPYRTFGVMCPKCGHHAMVFSIPTKVPFVRSSRTYDELDKIVKDFQERVREFFEKRKHVKAQLSLKMFEESDEEK